MTSEQRSQQTKPEDRLHASVTYGDLKVEFSGTRDEVAHSFNTFLAKQLPSYGLAKKLSLNYGAEELVVKFQEYVKITPEGPRVWINEGNNKKKSKKLSDKELVGLQLVAQKIAFETGTDSQPASTLARLQESTALNPKSLSSRLSELSKAGHVAKETTTEQGGTVFRVTTQGISWLLSSLMDNVVSVADGLAETESKQTLT